MKLEAYQELLWQLAIQSRPELQASERLPANMFRSPIQLDGATVSIEALTARHQEMSRRCKSAMDLQTRNAIRRRQTSGQGSVPIDITWSKI